MNINSNTKNLKILNLIIGLIKENLINDFINYFINDFINYFINDFINLNYFINYFINYHYFIKIINYKY